MRRVARRARPYNIEKAAIWPPIIGGDDHVAGHVESPVVRAVNELVPARDTSSLVVPRSLPATPRDDDDDDGDGDGDGDDVFLSSSEKERRSG